MFSHQVYCSINLEKYNMSLYQINLTKETRAPKEHRDNVSGAGRVVPRAFCGTYRDQAQTKRKFLESRASRLQLSTNTKASARRDVMTFV